VKGSGVDLILGTVPEFACSLQTVVINTRTWLYY